MGIFATHARRLFENGLSIIPIHTDAKGPCINEWNTYCDRLPTEDEFASWEDKHAFKNIGVACGKASRIIGFDLDTDVQEIYKIADEVFTPSPIRKRGAKGYTSFYKFEGQGSQSFDMNGGRVFDLISEGRQTILPPSIHKDTKAPYVWLTDDTLENYEIDSLPSLTQDQLDAFKFQVSMLLGQDYVFTGGRHDTVIAYLFANLETATSEEQICAKVMGYDSAKFGENGFFHDKAHRKGKSVKDFALYNVQNCIKTLVKKKGSFRYKSVEEAAIIEAEKKKKSKKALMYTDYLAGFNMLEILQGAYVEKLSHEARLNTKEPMLNVELAIKSYMSDIGLAGNDFKMHFYRWIYEMKPRYEVEWPEWDGVARIRDIASHIKVANMSSEHFQELICEWMAKMMQKIHEPGTQNLTPILHGRPKMGKDHFITFITEGLGDYYAEFEINEHQAKDVFQNQTTTICGHIQEIDRFARQCPSFLKSIFTSKTIKFRAPYLHAPKILHPVCSFIGSTNEIDMLKDPTGNRRYGFVEVVDIDRSYSDKHKDCAPQLIAEAIHYYKTKHAFNQDYITTLDRYYESDKAKVIDMMSVCVDEIETIIKKAFIDNPTMNTIPVSFFGDEYKRITLGRRDVLEQNLRRAINRKYGTVDKSDKRYYERNSFISVHLVNTLFDNPPLTNVLTLHNKNK